MEPDNGELKYILYDNPQKCDDVESAYAKVKSHFRRLHPDEIARLAIGSIVYLQREDVDDCVSGFFSAMVIGKQASGGNITYTLEAPYVPFAVTLTKGAVMYTLDQPDIEDLIKDLGDWVTKTAFNHKKVIPRKKKK